MTVFILLTWCIAAVTTASFLWAALIIKDVFHPLCYLMPMVAYLFVYLPWEVVSQKMPELNFLTDDEWAYSQGYNLICVLSLISGCLFGGHHQKHLPIAKVFVTSPDLIQRFYRFGLLLGGISVIAYIININNVGGLHEAYSHVKGGGTADSGYMRDAVFWAVPAIAILGFCAAHDKELIKYAVPGALFAIPHLLQGLLASRRGPTFMIVATVVVSWYFARRRRPSLPLFLIGGAALGTLLLLLVTYRDQFRLGSELANRPSDTIASMLSGMDEQRTEIMERSFGGNEFIYSASLMLTYAQQGGFLWGKRIAGVLFIRPIPRQLWPTKYEDCGLDDVFFVLGYGKGDALLIPPTPGAAPGFTADLFAEFAWFAIPLCFVFGWAYARSWRSAINTQGLGMLLYVPCVAYSLFFIIQTLEAFVFRLAFAYLPVLLFWRWAAIGRTLVLPKAIAIQVLSRTQLPDASSQPTGRQTNSTRAIASFARERIR
jgi:hypothetical protein